MEETYKIVLLPSADLSRSRVRIALELTASVPFEPAPLRGVTVAKYVMLLSLVGSI